ncbi:MAG TPA: sterol desaturase family protein [Chromatiales bacterium]|nr:sterol desaturase family protein [Thiotrichales bacterium]HIP69250.1 sterol desaturase family protein [Chromatiales bacterium]
MNKNYKYKKRKIEEDTHNQLRFGEGKISGISSLTLGILSFLAVLAYLYPSYLTTTELRQVYDAKQLQLVLKYGMYFSLLFGFLTFLLNKGKYKFFGMIGISFTLLAFLLGGYSIPVGSVEPRELSLGVDWLILAFLGSVFIFMTLEKLFPKYKEQVILRREWNIDLFYFVFNHLAISAIILFANYHATHFDWAISESLQETIRSVPVLLQLVIIIICADFVLYWEHRTFHEVKALWPIHAVHHSIENLDWLAGSRGHFIQVFSERAMVMIPLYLLGTSQEALNTYVAFAALQAILIHCNLSFSFGFLKYIFVTPQFHHWHHSSEKPAIDTNYSAHTVIFDRIFGTYHMPGKHWPAEYGTTVRLPQTVIGQTLYPIKALRNL